MLGWWAPYPRTSVRRSHGYNSPPGSVRGQLLTKTKKLDTCVSGHASRRRAQRRVVKRTTRVSADLALMRAGCCRTGARQEEELSGDNIPDAVGCSPLVTNAGWAGQDEADGWCERPSGRG
ncbi:hypothetical protein N9L68_04335 [bacterium]|nr:hypothetical protein [bacterium]